jgi:transcriptional antiterminator RfaH
MSFWCCAQLENNHIGLALHCLALAGYQTYAPRLRTVRVAHGRKLESRPLLFPSYVFVWIVAQWHAARWAPGVTRLVMAGDAVPARVPDGVIDELRAREGRDGLIVLPPPPGLKTGDRVRIVRGPFADRLACFAGMSGRDRVAVLLELLGRQQRVSLARDAVERLEWPAPAKVFGPGGLDSAWRGAM